MLLNDKKKKNNTNYYLEIYEHEYVEGSLYGMLKNNGEVVYTLSFTQEYFPIVLNICSGINRRNLMRKYKNKAIKELCKLRIRNKKPIRMVNCT